MEWFGDVLSKELKEDMISVSRNSDPVMSIELGLEEMAINIIDDYAPQVGSPVDRVQKVVGAEEHDDFESRTRGVEVTKAKKEAGKMWETSGQQR